MKRAGRIVYRLLSGLSLLLMLATAGVWVRSYWVSDVLGWQHYPKDHSFFDAESISCSRGGIHIEAERERRRADGSLVRNFYSTNDTDFFHNHARAYEYPAYGDDFDTQFISNSPHYAALGFEWIPEATMRYGTLNRDMRVKSLTLPLHFLALLFAILPTRFVLRFRRQRRIAKRISHGCCIACGYDLRASSGRCPECGRMESSTNPSE